MARKKKYIEYLDRATATTIRIDTDNLVKPGELERHVGETLTFHNGRGYIVSGVLTKGQSLIDDYAFCERYEEIEYKNEINMAMFYYPDRALSLYDSVEYAMMVVVNHCEIDEMMHNIKYIAKATDEEIAFREKLLTIKPEWFEKNFKKFDRLLNKYDKDPNCVGIEWDVLTDKDKKYVDKLFKQAEDGKHSDTEQH